MHIEKSLQFRKEQIEEWTKKENLQEDEQAEKDLLIEFFLNVIYQNKWLLKHLVFKGRTALHKIKRK